MQYSIDPIGQRGQALRINIAAEDLVHEPFEFFSSELPVLFAVSFLHTLSPAVRVHLLNAGCLHELARVELRGCLRAWGLKSA